MTDKVKGEAAATQAKPAEAVKFSEKLNDFLRNNRKAIIIAGIAILALVVALGAYSFVRQDRLTKSTAALEAIEASFDAWTAAAESEKAGQGDALLAATAELRKKHPGSYGALRASIVVARVLYARKDYAGAEAAFASVADEDPASHLAAPSLSNASAMAEERGDKEAALAYLLRADEAYPGAPGAARVVFSIGRVYEETKQYDKAIGAYERLVAAGEDDDWTKLARDRIIFLRSTGLAK